MSHRAGQTNRRDPARRRSSPLSNARAWFFSNASSGAGKSSRWCAPRLSVRASAAGNDRLGGGQHGAQLEPVLKIHVVGAAPRAILRLGNCCCMRSIRASAADNFSPLRNGPAFSHMSLCSSTCSEIGVAAPAPSLQAEPRKRSSAALRTSHANESCVCLRLRAALDPARSPKTKASVMALPDKRLAPLAPPTASPAA